MAKSSQINEAVRKEMFLRRLEQVLNWDCESEVRGALVLDPLAQEPPAMVTDFMDLAPKPALSDSVVRFADYVFSEDIQDPSRHVLIGLAEALLDAVETIQRSVASHERKIEAAVDRIEGIFKENRGIADQLARFQEQVDFARALQDRVSRLECDLRQRPEGPVSLPDKLPPPSQVTDKRREPRSLVNEPVEVVTLLEHNRLASGRAVNISNRGLGLTLDADIPIGTQAGVDISGVLVQGKVTRCRQEGDHWVVGIRLGRPLTNSWT